MFITELTCTFIFQTEFRLAHVSIYKAYVLTLPSHTAVNYCNLFCYIFCSRPSFFLIYLFNSFLPSFLTSLIHHLVSYFFVSPAVL